MADSHVPVYTTVLMNLAASDVGLATDEPDVWPAFDGSPTPVNIITANVYERLWRAASDEWVDVQAETEDCYNCGKPLLTADQYEVNVEPARHSMDDPYPGSSDIACDECAEVEK